MAAPKRRWPGPEWAPFQRGNLMEWVSPSTARNREVDPSGHGWGVPDEWRPNEPFRAALTLTGIERGRSAARFTWVDTSRSGETVHSYPMFMVDACALMLRGEALVGGVRDGWWIVMKRGANYGIAAIDPPDTGHFTPEAVEHSIKAVRDGVERMLVIAAYERADADGRVTAAALSRSFHLRSRVWLSSRLQDAYLGNAPIPGLLVSRDPADPVGWKVTFERYCPTCRQWVADRMPHPHDLEPAAWEVP